MHYQEVMMTEETLTARERLVNSTADLLERQGYYATGLNQILDVSKTPKGSLYHYFPEGKEELAAEAVELKGRMIAQNIKSVLAQDEHPADAFQRFSEGLAIMMDASGCQGGGPLAAVALETSNSSERLRETCANAYESWRVLFEEKMTGYGYEPEVAHRLSTLITAALEGAIILSRVQQSVQPIREVTSSLEQLVRDSAPSS
jgi:TetR/AcrR family transcriptional regulator, lmrAB and yxaGH operons repressor